MIQTVLSINGQDRMIGDGNTAEELKAIAVTLLRTAEAIRNREEGAIECIGRDGQNARLRQRSSSWSGLQLGRFGCAYD